MSTVARQTTEPQEVGPRSRLTNTSGELVWADLLRKSIGDYERAWAVDGPEGANTSTVSRIGTKSVRGTVSTNERIVKLPERTSAYRERIFSFHPLQEWEGTVTHISGDTFTATLTDLTENKQYADEAAEIPIDELTDDDREMLAPGRVFRWAIGYQRSAGGTKRRVSQISFRRLPQWTKANLAKAEEEAKSVARTLKWD